jgi:hypothetical protein
MEGVIVENVVKIFAFDTFVCAINGIDLKEYMKQKHKFSDEQFLEYLSVYRANLSKITVTEK